MDAPARPAARACARRTPAYALVLCGLALVAGGAWASPGAAGGHRPSEAGGAADALRAAPGARAGVEAWRPAADAAVPDEAVPGAAVPGAEGEGRLPAADGGARPSLGPPGEWARGEDAAAAGDTAGQAEGPRPFRHAAHDALSCRRCHASGAEHGAPRVWEPADCSSCHHAPATAMACERCHDAGGPSAALPLDAVLALSVWEAPRTRPLRFAHGDHGSVACGACHEAGARPASDVCASCHDDHHRPASDCARCHAVPPPEAHARPAHLGCAGAGCHERPAPPAVTLSRPACLLCHADRADHEPGGACGFCHFVPGAPAGGAP